MGETGPSLMRKRHLAGPTPYSRTLPRALRWSFCGPRGGVCGGGGLSDERVTPVAFEGGLKGLRGLVLSCRECEGSQESFKVTSAQFYRTSLSLKRKTSGWNNTEPMPMGKKCLMLGSYTYELVGAHNFRAIESNMDFACSSSTWTCIDKLVIEARVTCSKHLVLRDQVVNTWSYSYSSRPDAAGHDECVHPLVT